MSWITDIIIDEDVQLEKIYREHRDGCISWLKKTYALDLDDGLEIFQESIIILYDNVMERKVTEAKASLKSYLYAIAKNKSLEFLRKKKKTEPLQDYNFVLGIVLEAEREEKTEKEKQFVAIDIGLSKLGDPCKTLLQLFYYKKMKMDAISKLMGYSNPNTVKTQKYKCIQRLKKLIV
ncbi:MAG: sigma-70 family RNA polymerase sigma factor [Saprospiraceae bacterium]